MKKVIILGSTGSIGCNAVEVVKTLKDYRVVGLAAYSNHKLLAEQSRTLKPRFVAIIDTRKRSGLMNELGRTRILSGEEGIEEMIDALDADTIICALASSLGIRGVLRAIDKKMDICLATKEILVNFGDLVMKKVKRLNVRMIPIDSEHSAIYQCLEGKNREDVMNIILTASGGPFLRKSIKNVRKEDVLHHPVWKMGRKITVDSATMMNKGLEVIEAHHLFNFPAEMIKVVIHPEAICHSLVQFRDGTMLAQLSTPDMRLPIQYALTAPHRVPSTTPYLDIKKVKSLTFKAPNVRKFPCLQIAYEALQIGKTMPAVVNTANEEAVKLFLDDTLKFHEIPKIIGRVMKKHQPVDGGLQSYLDAIHWTKEQVKAVKC
jgi:1-deoxy-D-xylulose-5-phosphate reductoisomerase